MIPNSTQYHLRERAKSGNTEYLSWLLSPLEIGANSTVLDIGCGSGYVNGFLAENLNLRHNLGFDYDLDAVKLARELNASTRRISWFCASGETLPLPDACVDHIICRAILPYTLVDSVLSEIGRILRAGGNAALLLHSWSLYLHWLSLDARKWKQSAAGLVIFLQSIWFNLTGHEIQIRLGRRRVTQIFQTEFRIRKLLQNYEMSVYKVVREPEFIVYARANRRVPSQPVR